MDIRMFGVFVQLYPGTKKLPASENKLMPDRNSRRNQEGNAPPEDFYGVAPGSSFLRFCGTSSGKKTLDQGEGGGNPFASALIELLQRNELTIHAFRQDIATLTNKKSGGYQTPEVPPADLVRSCVLRPKPEAARHVAFVMVVSDYNKSEGTPSLPGAAHDAERVSDALNKAGFDTVMFIDPGKWELEQALADFTRKSKRSDVALFYTTGHGIEVDGATYLLPGDYPSSLRNEGLKAHAWSVNDFGKNLKAKHMNLLLFAGCRDNPYG